MTNRYLKSYLTTFVIKHVYIWVPTGQDVGKECCMAVSSWTKSFLPSHEALCPLTLST